MKVENMTISSGNKVANQFVITDYIDGTQRETFQSYDSVIATITVYTSNANAKPIIKLERNKWDYSKTTGKYRNQFLGETKKETQAKINSGEYILTDLN